MKWIRRLWFWYFDSWLGALWSVRYRVRPGEPESFLSGTHAPVLLLPGVYETWRYMLPIARQVHAAGHPVHVVSCLRHNAGPIPDAAAIAQRYLDENDLRGVVVIAHSKGGLIGKQMMAVDDTGQRIARMIAIATPFSGSPLAKYAPVRTLRTFRPDGGTLSRLARNFALNSRITSIYGEFDPVAFDASHLDGATNVQVAVIGHFRVLRDRLVLDAVAEALDPE